MSKTRSIEMYVGYLDHTWETFTVEIPAEITDELEIERAGIDAALSTYLPKRDAEVSFVGVYHYPS